jgi:hypothetical protein
MYVSEKKIKEASRVFEEYGEVLRTSEVLNQGIHRRTLYHMREKGTSRSLSGAYINLPGRAAFQVRTSPLYLLKFPVPESA